MNKSGRQYQKKLTTNSYNQEFIYYKYSKQLQTSSKSPNFKKHTLSYQQHEKSNNHSVIQSMKNTLNALGDPLVQGFSKSFNRSVAQFPSDTNRKLDAFKYAKSVYEQSNHNAQLNNKLELLTSNLRLIAQKPHFTSTDENKKNKTKRTVCKTSEDPYINNIELIHKKKQINFYAKMEEFVAKQANLIPQTSKQSNRSINFSQQLARSKSKAQGFFNQNQLCSSNSQSSSLKRYPRNLKNQMSVSTFNHPQQNDNEFEFSNRPRGKTVTDLFHVPSYNRDDRESTKIKINQQFDRKQPSIKTQSNYCVSGLVEKGHLFLTAHVVNVLQPHRGPINSIIINSDGRRFLTASNDYMVKQSNLDGSYTALRKHKGRVNVLRMIDDRLYSGGNDCRIKFEKGNFTFQSPVLEIYPHEREQINVGTNSSIQLFNLVKKVSSNKVDVKTKSYKLLQKINRQVYFVDNHHLSIIDWRVPYPLINLLVQPNFVQQWLSDPYSPDFYQIRDKKLLHTNNSNQNKQIHTFQEDIKDYCWKKDKVYFLTQNQLQLFQTSPNTLHKKSSYLLNHADSEPCKLQIKNDLWIYGTLDGKLIVNKFN